MNQMPSSKQKIADLKVALEMLGTAIGRSADQAAEAIRDLARTARKAAMRPDSVDNETIVERSILLRNGSRVTTPCYVTKVHGTDEMIYEPVDKAQYREDTRVDDRERTYLLPGEGVAASEQDWSR